MTRQRILKPPEVLLKRYSPLVLSCVATIGVAVTAVSAAKATPKAIKLIRADSKKNHDGNPNAFTKKEAFMSAWKCYIPSIIFGASTILCIAGAQILNTRQQASLASAYMFIQNSYNQYKSKLKELYGEEAHNKIVDSIIKEKISEVHISCPGLCSNSTLEFDTGMEPEISRTFYDSFSNRYFESTISNVIQAEYHLNRNFMLGGAIDLNSFYEFLGLSKIDIGDSLGWDSRDGELYWIDFNHRISVLDDGMEIYVIDMVFEPAPNWV